MTVPEGPNGRGERENRQKIRSSVPAEEWGSLCPEMHKSSGGDTYSVS